MIDRLAALFGAQRAAGVTLGIGDDAAVLRPPAGRDLVWTVDTQIEGQHFRRAWLTLEDLGWRSFVAAASDLAALGAEPWCALASLGLTDDLGVDGLDALSGGQAEAAAAVGCPIVGGNLSRAGELSVTTTLLGTVDRAVGRSGARPGDGVWIVGEVGLSAAGLRAIVQGAHGADVDAAIARFRRPAVRIDSGRVLGRSAHAAIDISDGVARDAGHVASASHAAIVLDEEALLTHGGDVLARAAAAVGEPPIDLVLGGGEDYALLCAASDPLRGFTRVGEVEVGAGVWLRDHDGKRRLVDGRGFDHFDRRR